MLQHSVINMEIICITNILFYYINKGSTPKYSPELFLILGMGFAFLGFGRIVKNLFIKSLQIIDIYHRLVRVLEAYYLAEKIDIIIFSFSYKG